MTLFGEIRLPLAAAALAAAVAGTGCADIIGADFATYTQREEKVFTTSGKPDVSVATFDGSIEIRPWNRSEVRVIVEKRAMTKEAADTIDIHTEQNGDRITVDVKVPKTSRFGSHFHQMRSAKLIVSMPASSNLAAASGDGSIDIEGIAGRVELRSGDGDIRGRELGGDVNAHTGDGSIRLDAVTGALSVDTGDGNVSAAGTFTSVRARSGDGSVQIAAQNGSTSASDWNISTGDGSVTLSLPDDFNADLDAHTGDGGIHMQNLELSNVTGALGRDSVRGRIGSGGRTVRVRTGDGSITLKRSSNLS
jgi:hypothetical protein